jgi:cobyrinic acid a,c-diamide synthase
LAAAIEHGLDLDAVLALARRAPCVHVPDPRRAEPGGRARVAVASGAAFDFVYRDNLEALEAAGAELLPFDPLEAEALPDGADAVYAGGGFPEVFAEGLAANRPLLADLRARDLVTWAECGGLLWLARSLDGHPLSGVVDAEARMTGRLTLGYRRAVSRIDHPLASAGTELRGHEFHYSSLEPAGDALRLEGRAGSTVGGFASPRLLASYLHLHLGGDPSPATRFVRAAVA